MALLALRNTEQEQTWHCPCVHKSEESGHAEDKVVFISDFPRQTNYLNWAWPFTIWVHESHLSHFCIFCQHMQKTSAKQQMPLARNLFLSLTLLERLQTFFSKNCNILFKIATILQKVYFFIAKGIYTAGCKKSTQQLLLNPWTVTIHSSVF